MSLNDYELALLCQQQYDGKIPIRIVADIAYSRLDDVDQVTLIFRGTSDLEDAKEDLNALMKPCPFGRVHSGAWEGLQNVIDSENLPNKTPILIIGHSLGAMRAQLAYRELYRRGYLNIRCVTFECPRFGDSAATEFATSLKADHTYQNYKDMWVHDMFTMIPVWLLGEPYVDVLNCTVFWSAPTPSNEYKLKYDAPINIQCHSLSDCVLPGLAKLFC